MKCSIKAKYSIIIFLHEIPKDFDVWWTYSKEDIASLGYTQLFGWTKHGSGEFILLNILHGDDVRHMYE